MRICVAFPKYLRIHQQQFQLSGSAISDFMIYSFLLIRMMRDIRRRVVVVYTRTTHLRFSLGL